MVDSSDLRRSANSTLSWVHERAAKTRSRERPRLSGPRGPSRWARGDIDTRRMKTRGFKNVFREGRKRAQVFEGNNGREIVFS